jgi:hypothetical protein
LQHHEVRPVSPDVLYLGMQAYLDLRKKHSNIRLTGRAGCPTMLE